MASLLAGHRIDLKNQVENFSSGDTNLDITSAETKVVNPVGLVTPTGMEIEIHQRAAESSTNPIPL